MIRVIQSFKDKVTGEVYPIGKELELDEERTKDLINRGLAKLVEEKKDPKGISLFEKEFEKKALVDALKTIGSKATGNMGEATLLGLVSELDEETTAKLQTALGIE